MIIKSALGFLGFALRILLSALATYLIYIKVPLPFPAVVSIWQITLYLSFIFVPLRLDTILLRSKTDSMLVAIEQEYYNIPHHIHKDRIMISQFWDSPVEKAAQIRFISKASSIRKRAIEESFIHDIIPLFLITAITIAFSIFSASGQIHINNSFMGSSSLLSFVQGLIVLMPLLIILGKLFGVISCHRDTVFIALDANMPTHPPTPVAAAARASSP